MVNGNGSGNCITNFSPALLSFPWYSFINPVSVPYLDVKACKLETKTTDSLDSRIVSSKTNWIPSLNETPFKFKGLLPKLVNSINSYSDPPIGLYIISVTLRWLIISKLISYFW